MPPRRQALRSPSPLSRRGCPGPFSQLPCCSAWGTDPPTRRAAASWHARLPPEHRTLIFSVKLAGAPLGGALAGLALPPVAALAGWAAALWLAAGLALAAALTIQPLRPVLDDEREPHRPIGPAALFAPANLAAPFAALRLHPLLVPLSVLACSFNAVQGCLFALTVAFLVEARGLTLVEAGAAYAVMQGTGVVGRLALGWLADRTGTPARNLFLQALFASGLTSIFVLLPPGAPVGLFLLAAGAAGFAATSWGGLLLAEVARLTPLERVTDATSGTVLVCFIGYSAGPMLCAAAVSATGGWTAPMLVVAAQLAAMALALWPRAGGRRP
ncbi:MFS transporter [Siccirubricoccus sp. G192]|uniref:MFS transporter n=1 Tax=Siccirubricoccus sp. G192 TaxID=2849651 RepID=UPI0028122A4F|nr:MFS transporter [Siccirubricoccus sp. G192]